MAAIFEEFNFGEEYFGDGDPTPSIDEDRVGWVFFDGTSTYVLPINPVDASMPSIQKQLTNRPISGSQTQLIFEGRPQVGNISFSGTILTQNQYNTFRAWVFKRKQIRITDDLNRKYWVYLTSFTPTRQKTTEDHPWHMEYQAQGLVLDRG